jgi:hypothetical protein
MGYAKGNQVRLYGEVFDLLSDPVSIGDNLVVVDAIAKRSGSRQRVHIPLSVLNRAKQETDKAP